MVIDKITGKGKERDGTKRAQQKRWEEIINVRLN